MQDGGRALRHSTSSAQQPQLQRDCQQDAEQQGQEKINSERHVHGNATRRNEKLPRAQAVRCELLRSLLVSGTRYAVRFVSVGHLMLNQEVADLTNGQRNSVEQPTKREPQQQSGQQQAHNNGRNKLPRAHVVRCDAAQLAMRSLRLPRII